MTKIINGWALHRRAPIEGMVRDKRTFAGTSWGLSEAGYDLRIAQDLTLHPFARFKLASTIERFDMPDDLVGLVFDKSTWARRGLSLFNTVIEPGWRGFLTLELSYVGLAPLRIKRGQGIAQVLFVPVNEPAAYSGKYQDQPAGPVGARECR